MALKYVMINDIIEEHNARMQNLRKYYPFLFWLRPHLRSIRKVVMHSWTWVI